MRGLSAEPKKVASESGVRLTSADDGTYLVSLVQCQPDLSSARLAEELEDLQATAFPYATAYLMVHYFTIRSVQFLSGIL